jgi:trehalose/maltose hydrolase-like predicted phosphorylase
MAGTLDLIQRGYMGVEIRDGALTFDPKLTDKLDGISYTMMFRGTSVRVKLSGGELTVTPLPGGADSVKVGLRGTVAEVKAGESKTFAL